MKMIALSVVLALAIAAPAAQATETELTGTWTLVYADVIRPDGSLGHDYGASPNGLLMIDDHGNYSQQIYDAARPKFAAGDKAKATADEYRAAIVGASIHFGAITVEPAKHSFT